MNMDDEISLLRKQRLESIDECNFSQAKAIELQIQKLQKMKKENSIRDMQTNSNIKYRIERENVRTEASELYNKFYTQVYQTKSRFQNRRTLIQQSHSNLLSKMANEYAKELEIETTRAIPEADTLKREAQIRARASEYEAAESLFKESTDLREKITKQRQDAVHKKYNSLEAMYESKHDEEEILCSKKQRQAFVEIKTTYDAEIAKLDKKLTACSLRLGITRPIEEEDELFKTLEIDELKENPSADLPISPRSTRKTPTNTPKSRTTPLRSSKKYSQGRVTPNRNNSTLSFQSPMH